MACLGNVGDEFSARGENGRYKIERYIDRTPGVNESSGEFGL